MLFPLALLFAQGQTNPPLLDVGQDPPRLRTLIPNGSTLLVEPAPASKNLIVHLFAAARGVDESKTSGLRHLLEHLCVKGTDGTLDERLETQAAFLTAHVLRDALDVEIQAPPDKLSLALDAIKDVLAAHGWGQAAIAHEAGIIEQEIDLREDTTKLSSALWAAAYGGNGADPIGDLDTIRAATPESLEAVREATFAPANLVLVIEGPVTLKEGTRLGSAMLSGRAGAPTRQRSDPQSETRVPALQNDGSQETRVGAPALRVPKTGPSREVVDAFGEAHAVAVPPINDPKCAAAICAALAIASEIPDAFVTYTPTALNGLVIVGQTNEIGDVGTKIDAINADGADGLFDRGRMLGVRWATRQIATPESSAYTRGLLMCNDVELRFETVRTLIANLSLADFRAAMARFGVGHAFVAVGKP